MLQEKGVVVLRVLMATEQGGLESIEICWESKTVFLKIIIIFWMLLGAVGKGSHCLVHKSFWLKYISILCCILEEQLLVNNRPPTSGFGDERTSEN